VSGAKTRHVRAEVRALVFLIALLVGTSGTMIAITTVVAAAVLSAGRGRWDR